MGSSCQSSIEAVIEAERQWVQAHRDLDIHALERLVANDYRQIRDDGFVIGRDEFIASYRSGTRSWEIAESDQYDVRLFGEVALLIGRWRGKGVHNGKHFDYSARFLAVYVLEDGKWKLASDVSIPLD